MYVVSILVSLLFIGAGANAQLLPYSFGSESLFVIGSNGNSVELKPGTIPTSFSLTLPTDAGANGEVLQTDGTGVLSWASPSSTGTPAGTIITFAGPTCPTDFLAADGSAVSRSTYATLYAALGGASSPWGQGDGSTTFNVPDLRDRFLRGTGTNSDGNGGGAVSIGAYQSDAFQGHYHSLYGLANQGSNPGTADRVQSGSTLLSNSAVRDPVTDGTNGTPRTAPETRPKSYGVLMCIKS